jgi:hypothetical protein
VTGALAPYHRRGEAIVRADVEGIDAGLVQVERDTSLLPAAPRAAADAVDVLLP